MSPTTVPLMVMSRVPTVDETGTGAVTTLLPGENSDGSFTYYDSSA